jgi:hypothetical protein
VAAAQYTFTHKQYTENTTNYLGRLRAVPRFASYTLAFVLQLRKKHGKTSARVAEECQMGTMETKYTEQSIHNIKNT